MEGLQHQTAESIEILKESRVPFAVAANKIDRIPGWKPQPDKPFLESIKMQNPSMQARLDQLIYRIVEQLYNHGFVSERFDRIRDFRRTVLVWTRIYQLHY